MTEPEAKHGSALPLVEALVAIADPGRWARYCRLALELTGAASAPGPVFAIGSAEWQQQQSHPSMQQENALEPAAEAAGRQRLMQRGAAPAFAGVPPPFGAASGPAFDEFVGRHAGPPKLSAEIAAVEQQIVDAFDAAGRAGRYRAAGFCNGAKIEVEPDWFGQMQLDFAGNRLILPGGSVIAGVEAMLAPVAAAGRGTRERPAKAMLREALTALWARGAFTAGTGNERVLALVLQELRLSASDPPYGFKSAETIRKLRKQLNLSL